MTNVLFFGHGATADEIRSRLFDLRAVGLLDNFMWVDYTHPTSAAVVRSFDAEGTPRISTLDDALHRHEGDILLVVLDSMDEAQPLQPEALSQWAAAVDSRIVQASNQRVRLLLSALPLRNVHIEPLQVWENLVLSPEEGGTPSSTRIRPIPRTEDGFELAQFAAPAVASIFGLWRGMPQAAVFDPDTGRLMETGNRENFRLVRAFHRTIDASAVENAVKDRVFNPNRPLPRPQLRNNSHAERVTDPARLTQYYSDTLFAMHGSSLLSPEIPLESPKTQKVSAWAALRDNLRLYWAMVIGKPQDWVNSHRGTVNSATAGFLQNLLYGQNSNMEVVLDGHSGKGNAVSIQQMQQKNQRTLAEAQKVQFDIGQAPQLSGMWEAYHDFALGLVDGQWKEDANFTPQKGSQQEVLIVQYGQQSVPDMSNSFLGFHPLMHRTVGYNNESEAKVAPFDPIAAEKFAADLDWTSQVAQNTEVNRKKQEFAAWRNQNQNSFAWKVGTGLAQRLGVARQRVDFYETEARRLREEEKGFAVRDFNDENRRLTNKLRASWGILTLVLVVLFYMCLANYNPDVKIWDGMLTLDWRWTTFGVILSIILFLLLTWLMFTKAQREIYDYVQMQKLNRQNQEIAARNIVSAAADVDRILNAYSQFLSWSAILGRAIYAPFGLKSTTSDHLRTPESGLPDNARIGQAQVSEDETNRMAEEIRSQVYSHDWAHKSLRSLVDYMNSVFERNQVGQGSVQLSAMWGMRGENSNTQLDLISRHLDHPFMASRDEKPQVWHNVITNPRMAGRLQHYLSSVTFLDENRRQTQSTEQFLAGMSQEKGAMQAFSNEALTTLGASAGYTEIDPDYTRTIEVDSNTELTSQLSRSLTVVQFGRITDFKYLVPKEERLEEAVPSAFFEDALSDLDDTDHIDSFNNASQVQPGYSFGNETSNTANPFGFGQSQQPPSLDDLDDTF